MISQLSIQNFGLIDKATLEFTRGLTILTGETGAGKSIIIDGLRFALGERLNSSQVRDPKLPCIVEVVFELSPAVLAEYPSAAELANGEDQLIINRAWLPEGKNRIRINGMAVTVSQLKELGDHLLDFHGPNDHQMLLSESSHLFIIDRLAGCKQLKDEYSQRYSVYDGLLKEQQRLNELAAAKQRDIELYAHQIKELEQAPLDENACAELLEKRARLTNVEKLHELCRQVLESLENEQSGLCESLDRCFAPLKQMARLDPSAEKFGGGLSGIREQSAEFISTIRNYAENLSFDEEEAQEIYRLCDVYEDIKRKYGPGLDEAKKFYGEIKEKHETLTHFEETSQQLQERISQAEVFAFESADKLSRKRKNAAKELKKTIEQELKELGIRHVEFECRFEKTALGPTGADSCVFYISPNAGEQLKPLADIASSGEAARLMLALKKALINVDPIPVLVFDEIDAQIGGRLGTVTGEKLKELSRNRQVILITHLPQIASFADRHFKVSKKVSANHTVTSIDELDPGQAVVELAAMMSGEKESAIALSHAKEMLAKAKTSR